MGNGTPLYSPGYSRQIDANGHEFESALNITERSCLIGHAWRIETGYSSIAAAGSYLLMNFKTPATGRCYYTFITVDKSGAEVVVSLIRGGTVTGASAAAAFNYDDDVLDSTCPLIDTTTGGTVSGGTERFISLVPGDSKPSSKPGGNSRAQGLIKLRKNTVYSVKMLAKGDVNLAANIGISYVAEDD